MRITRTVAFSASLALLTAPAQAQFIGLDIGPEHWPASHARASSADRLDDERVDARQPAQTLVLEHAISALPNIRFRGYTLDSDDAAELGANISFNGESLSVDDPARSSFDLSHDDIVLYYQLSGNRVDLDLGVDLKRFDGQVSSGVTNTTVDIDETIPLFYLSARYSLNNSGFYVGADINASFIDLGLSESDARDSTFMLGYDAGDGIGVEGGIKYYSLELDNAEALDPGLQYDGIYLNGYINF